MADLVVTIDGPAASGKSTVARLLAKKLNASFLDTGAMYRAVTLAAMKAGANLKDQQQLLAVLENAQFDFSDRDGKTAVRLNGADVTELIRSPVVTADAKYIADAPKMREKLVAMQQKFAQSRRRIVTEGRDQGTVAFPDADIKFYLIASLDERAERRQAELEAKGIHQTLEQIRKAIEERDAGDQSRAVGPLKPADDAVVVDTTNLTIEQVIEKLYACVKEKCPNVD
jgi:cytidylate kinase